MAKITNTISEYLRIGAIRRIFAMVDVKKSEIAGLIAIAAAVALFEGMGLSLLLPVLQYAQNGVTAIQDSSNFVWTLINRTMGFLHLPVTLPVLLGLAFVPILLRNAMFYVNAWYSSVVSTRIALRMRVRTLDSIMAADPGFFSEHSAGRLVGVIVTQTALAGNAILSVISELSVVMLIVLYLALMLAISVPLTLLAAFFGVLVSLAVRSNAKRIKEFSVASTKVSQEMMAKIVERLGLMKLIKLRDTTKKEAASVEGLSDSIRSMDIKRAKLGARTEVTADPLLMLSAFLVLYIGLMVLHMTLAQLALILFILTRLNAKIKEFNGGLQAISAGMASVELVRKTTSEAEAANTIRGKDIVFSGLSRELELEGVCFTYPSAGAPGAGGASGAGGAHTAGAGPHGEGEAPDDGVLKDITATIPAGSFTALVGRSGAGKSTLVELLLRLMDVGSGRILFDGVPIEDFELGSLRKGIGYLTQDPMLFNDTVRSNLLYGLDREPSEEEVRHALDSAFATFVYDLPKGLETMLGDSGVRFSGGERQRIALARVLLQKTDVMILDEPTSALDSESESYIQAALRALHGKKTIITVAHRLATVIQSDQILVIDNGTILERGTHDELLRRGGAYQKLFSSQLL